MADKTTWDFEKSLTVLTGKFGDRVLVDRALSDLNTFGTGGKARLFVEVKTSEELAQLVKIAAEIDIPFFMLGGGSNLLVSDSGYDGLIIRNSVMGMERDADEISCGAGEKLQSLVDFAAENGLAGLEFASGIWGTVGGAIYGNAGAYGGDIGSILKSAELVDRQGSIRTEAAGYFEFGYRSSKLKETGEFVSRAKFALKVGEKETIRGKIDEIMSLRDDRLPVGMHTAGCFFKNIPDKTKRYGKLSAGQLLEEVGAKKLRCGGAKVFENHANILINEGTAKSDDIKRLAELMKLRVKEKFGIELQEEIIFLGDFQEERL